MIRCPKGEHTFLINGTAARLRFDLRKVPCLRLKESVVQEGLIFSVSVPKDPVRFSTAPTTLIDPPDLVHTFSWVNFMHLIFSKVLTFLQTEMALPLRAIRGMAVRPCYQQNSTHGTGGKSTPAVNNSGFLQGAFHSPSVFSANIWFSSRLFKSADTVALLQSRSATEYFLNFSDIFYSVFFFFRHGVYPVYNIPLVLLNLLIRLAIPEVL